MLSIRLVSAASLFYVLLLFLVAWYANRRQRQGRSIVSNPIVYTLSIAVYLTSWTFYGSVGRAATSGLDFILIYLGPSLAAFSWWFVLRKIVRISKGNNITSIADFLSSRYGNSLLLGALVAIIAIIGNMPYIALQLKAVSTTFHILCGETHIGLPFLNTEISLPPAFLSALLLSIFSVVFGARLLVASERHEGMVAAIALESLVKLFAFLTVGLFVTYTLFNGFTDIFSRMQTTHPELLDRLTSLGAPGELSFAHFFTVLYLSLGAIMLLPRQFHIMVIENSDEEHIKTAMWGFPAYMFLINLFVLPIALGGILLSGGTQGADYFVLTLPMQSGQKWLSLLAFLGGFSAAAGMVMVASVTLSTMFLNHLLMPILVRFKPRSWFPTLLVTLKRMSIFLIIFLGYFYHLKVGDTFMLVDIGLIAFTAVAQFGPSLIGGLYWQRGNRAGAVSGIVLGFLIWVYTLLIPSFIYSGWLSLDILHNGPFGIELLKPTELFGLSGFDIWTHALFWSMFFNVGAYLICSILLPQEEKEQEQAHKFVEVFTAEGNGVPWETKRLSKPITINQIANLLSKFIGEEQTKAALSSYLGSRRLNSHAGISEFELPRLKRFTERTLAASVGAAASGAIVESYLSDIGSRLEPVYDIFSTVRASLDESRENLYVRLRASEIMNRTLDLQIIMDDLLDLLMKEFKLDLGVVWLRNKEGKLVARSFRGSMGRSMAVFLSAPANSAPILDTAGGGVSVFVNDTSQAASDLVDPVINQEGIKSYAHIPLARQGEEAVGVISFYSRS
ncbi:MAG TPA: stage II sporulation protein E, partial [Geobacterales bacterium]|nr:stage II sporulation protein E [Geobacterales bacterium]